METMHLVKYPKKKWPLKKVVLVFFKSFLVLCNHSFTALYIYIYRFHDPIHLNNVVLNKQHFSNINTATGFTVLQCKVSIPFLLVKNMHTKYSLTPGLVPPA